MSALSRLKNRKSPGPDQLPAEIWKYAPREVHKSLLAHFNQAFRNAESPRSWKVADIVMIFKGKKKDPTLPASYRPISLINSVYKIYACLLHARLKAAIDDRISPVQFGFRAGRSTSTPLFVLRRLLELHERHQESFFALFLDWSQAFDSVSHNALCNALSRFGIPPQFAEPILSIYHDCHFTVKDAGHLSRSKHFAQGIRQGCPLSPYLFVITLSVLFHDTYEAYQHTYGPRPSVLTTDYRLTDIEYADDMVLLSRTRLSLHRFLHTLQAHSLKRGMSLNQEKCQLLAINSDLPIYLNVIFVSLNPTRSFRKSSGSNLRHMPTIWGQSSCTTLPLQPIPRSAMDKRPTPQNASMISLGTQPFPFPGNYWYIPRLF